MVSLAKAKNTVSMKILTVPARDLVEILPHSSLVVSEEDFPGAVTLGGVVVVVVEEPVDIIVVTLRFSHQALSTLSTVR